MRIGMVTACYWPVVNGVTRVVSLYREHLEAAGHEVTVFTLGKPAGASADDGVIRSPGLPLGRTGYYVAAGYSRAARNRLRRMDILHCHHLAMSVELAHRYSSAPIVYTNHTRYDLYAAAHTPLPPPAARALMRRAWPALASRADVIIAPSTGVRDVMRAFGVDGRIEVIPNGIDLFPYSRPEQPWVKGDLGLTEDVVLFVYTGRLSPEKNVNVLLEQFARAHVEDPAVRLLLVGGGPLAGRMARWAEALGIREAVHFAGALPPADVGGALAAGDAFVTASVSEVHPLSVIEALAAGLPVAGVASPGINELVEDGANGRLVERPEDLARAMVELAAAPEERRRMAAAARSGAAHYDIEHTVQRTVDLYRELLAVPGREQRRALEGAASGR